MGSVLGTPEGTSPPAMSPFHVPPPTSLATSPPNSCAPPCSDYESLDPLDIRGNTKLVSGRGGGCTLTCDPPNAH